MGIEVYVCEKDFPDRIPAILSRSNPPMKCERSVESEAKQRSHNFRYRVERGLGRISISGGLEEDVIVVFILFDSQNPLRWRANSRLTAEVESMLVESGMRVVSAEENEDSKSK